MVITCKLMTALLAALQVALESNGNQREATIASRQAAFRASCRGRCFALFFCQTPWAVRFWWIALVMATALACGIVVYRMSLTSPARSQTGPPGPPAHYP